MSSHHITKITQTTFKDVLSRYKPAVPEKLHDLDALRYDTIPTAVAKRKADDRHLTKDEVEKLVEWKLKHGTFRPKLLSLVQSNPADVVQETTTSAFKMIPKQPLPALKILTNLKGIGPATASLLLSVAAPDVVPFFSDELFRWCMWDESGSPSGWQRKIKYNVKEYEMLLEKVNVLIERLGVRAVDVERVAWVLGKESVDIDAGSDGVGEEKSEQDEAEEEKVTEEKTVKKEVKKGTKRKASEAKPPTEGTRKSTRTKK
ncbi:hypothetical protein HBI73_034400 [Parastagonospora nodorum]|nr:hypothetical protein HBI73_034400 [Parastagonospora nodorum]KAH5479227.1 hypothetical protein HBI28_043380 [Parastagonospora nodorum]KAH5633873.1 hypothetical protein HBI51_179530 [Parastagonospora nodorum]KAH5642315.1 hypothetical protein HBI22_051650 [Parastagonospora nodorum]KAH5670702.1 hypothetical protein HBI21_183510 [Parastagonospora nodorum]